MSAAVACWCILCAATLHAAVIPDASTARAFGAELARSYSVGRTQAIVDRLDPDTVLARVFSPRVLEGEGAEKMRAEWAPKIKTWIGNALKPFDHFKVMLAARVILADDARWLDCVFLTENGVAQYAALRLVQTPAGEVRVGDVAIGGNALTYAQALRQTFILMRLPVPQIVDPEELELREQAATCGYTATLGLEALGEQKYDVAFKYWSDLTPEMKKTRLWRDIRDRMALTGSAGAREDVARDVRAGKPVNRFVQLYLALLDHDNAGALAAIDGVLQTCRALAFFRSMKAGLLIAAGRPMEAYELAHDVMEVTPASGSAYVIAVRAGVAAKRADLAVEALKHWQRATPASAIDDSVAAQPELKAFRESAEYAAWRKAATAP